MSDDRRNPYLVLGVPYGTNRAGATRAFAQRSRRAKRDASFPYTVEDLTWALHQVEANLDDPAIAIDHFRVPADPAQLHTPDGPGILRPPAVALDRRTEPAGSASIEVLRQQAVEEARTSLLAQAAANGRAAYIPAKPVRPGNLKPQTGLKPKRLLWPWIVIGLLMIAIAIAIAAIAAASVTSSGIDRVGTRDTFIEDIEEIGGTVDGDCIDEVFKDYSDDEIEALSGGSDDARSVELATDLVACTDLGG